MNNKSSEFWKQRVIIRMALKSKKVEFIERYGENVDRVIESLSMKLAKGKVNVR